MRLLSLGLLLVACTEPEPKRTPGPTGPIDTERETLARECQKGDAASCVTLGEHVAADVPSTPVAESWYQLGCQKGSMRGCALLGGALLVRNETLSAHPLLERACQGGDDVGCFNLAWILAFGPAGIAPDQPRALGLFETTCAKGLGAACQNRGWMSEKGVATKTDLRAAADWYGQGCQAGAATSCTTLGLMSRDGRGVPVDKLNARTLFARGCELGDAAACEAEKTL